jgi:hypothetical protein
MRDEDGIHVQFCYIPDYKLFGQVVEIAAYHYIISYVKHDIEYEELFDKNDIILMKEINIPIEREVEE